MGHAWARLGPLFLAALLALPAPALAQGRASRPELTPEQMATARAELEQARLHYERGEWGAAVRLFILTLETTPRRLRERDDLHAGFLYYAFTLFLQGEAEQARDRLGVALRLDPQYRPSPVTTRPDLLQFYNTERDAWVAAHGSEPTPLQEVFPDLAPRPVRRGLFVPAAGFGLRQLGHRGAGDAFLVAETSLLVANVGLLISKAALRPVTTRLIVEDVKPALGYATLPTAISLWTVFAVDVISSIVLYRRYQLHPELRPTARPRRRAAVALGPMGVVVRW